MKKYIDCYWDRLLLVFVYTLNVFYVWLNGRNLLNSDVASELILAKELNHEGKIVTSNWFYSSELRVLNTQLIYKLAFRLFPNDWNSARTLSEAMFLIVLVLCALYYAKAAELSKSIFLFAVVLITPLSCWYGWNVVYNLYYIPHIAISLVAVSLQLRYWNTESKHRRILIAVCAVLLAFTAGLGGIRQLMICYVPLLLAVLWFLWQKKRDLAKRKELLRYLSVSSLVFIASSFGFLVNHLILRHRFHFENRASLFWDDISLSKLLNCLSELIGLYGWHKDIQVLSIYSAGNMLCLLLVAFIICGTVWCFRRDDLTDRERIALYYMAALFIVLLPVYSFTESYNASYWTVFTPFSFIPCWIWGKRQNSILRKTGWKVLIATTVLICSMSTMHSPYIDWVPDARRIQPVSQWLKQSGYTKGFSEFWDGNVITALTDGEVEMWVYNDLTKLEFYEWLQKTSHKDSYPEGEVFIICPAMRFENDESVSADSLSAIQSHLVYGDEYYYVYLYSNAEEYISQMSVQ